MGDTKEQEHSPLNQEILGLVRHRSDVHYALETLFRSCAPGCIPAENTLHLISQISNALAGNLPARRCETLAALADMYAEQVGTGPLLSDVRHGFRRLAAIARGYDA